MPLLSARNISHSYRDVPLIGPSTQQPVLHDLNFDIHAGETVAFVGRSGCGKSTMARLLVGLETPVSGHVLFEGENLARLSTERQRQFRRSVQMVFQDPLSSVNPRQNIGKIIGEPLLHLTTLNEGQRRARILELLDIVGLRATDIEKRPPEMSGGQLQRVCIARALAPTPHLIILDEAVSNLDLLLQIQILDLLRKLQAETGISFLFITHDLRLVERFCSRMLVVDRGEIVEECPVNGQIRLQHRASRLLQEAILPAWPTDKLRPAKAPDMQSPVQKVPCTSA